MNFEGEFLDSLLGVSESRYVMRQLAKFDKASSDGATLSPTWIAEERMVLRYLREHPGEADFPYNILDHLAVEKRLYHYESGVDFQALAGYPLSPEHLRKFIPPRTRIICYPPGVSEFHHAQDARVSGRLPHARLCPGVARIHLLRAIHCRGPGVDGAQCRWKDSIRADARIRPGSASPTERSDSANGWSDCERIRHTVGRIGLPGARDVAEPGVMGGGIGVFS